MIKDTRGEENRPWSSLTRAQNGLSSDIDESFEFSRLISILDFADVVENILII